MLKTLWFYQDISNVYPVTFDLCAQFFLYKYQAIVRTSPHQSLVLVPKIQINTMPTYLNIVLLKKYINIAQP